MSETLTETLHFHILKCLVASYESVNTGTKNIFSLGA